MTQWDLKFIPLSFALFRMFTKGSSTRFYVVVSHSAGTTSVMHYTDNLNRELANPGTSHAFSYWNLSFPLFYAFLFLHFSTHTILLHFFLPRYIRSWSFLLRAELLSFTLFDLFLFIKIDLKQRESISDISGFVIAQMENSTICRTN